MRATFLGWLVRAMNGGLAAALALIAILAPISPFADESPALGQEQRQTELDRCQFMVDKVNSIILSLNAKGEITFLNHYGQRFFGYSDKEVLGKPMLGILTPSAGFEGRDLAAFLTGLVREPNRYAYSVNVNMLRNGERVWIFWANKGIYDHQGQVLEVLRVGVDITGREHRLEAATQDLRNIGNMLQGRAWVQRRKLEEITGRIEEISQELERPWKQTKAGVFESVAPPNH
jgi:PAS domain S-box-containing protein